MRIIIDANKRPSIEALTSFAKLYFGNEPCPTIQYDEKLEKGRWGEADQKNKKISINPYTPWGALEDNIGRESGLIFYQPTPSDIILNEGEQYFLVLLHEVGHFKKEKIWRVPEEWLESKKQLEAKYPGDEEDRPRCAVDYIKKVEGECEAAYSRRVGFFQLWCFLQWSGQCKKFFEVVIDEWAINEFKKRRREIRNILNLNIVGYDNAMLARDIDQVMKESILDAKKDFGYGGTNDNGNSKRM